MKKLHWTLLFVFVFALSGCQKACTSLQRDLLVGNRDYAIIQFSGGDTVGVYTFRGMLNDAEGSDGYYWYKRDTLYEVGGDLIIRSTD